MRLWRRAAGVARAALRCLFGERAVQRLRPSPVCRSVLPTRARAGTHRARTEQLQNPTMNTDGYIVGTLMALFSGAAVCCAAEPRAAVVGFTKAARGGLPEGECNLAQCCLNGLGTAVSLAEATTWYRCAADHGNAQAMLALGDAYAEGLGVEPSIVAARRWYRTGLQQAVQNGDSWATGKAERQLRYILLATVAEREIIGPNIKQKQQPIRWTSQSLPASESSEYDTDSTSPTHRTARASHLLRVHSSGL